MIYEVVPPGQTLTQGDILDGCALARVDADDRVIRWTSRVIVLTQACDIAQIRSERIAVAGIYPASQIVEGAYLDRDRFSGTR